MKTQSTSTDFFQFGFRSVGLWNVELDVDSQRFLYGDRDVTDQLSHAQRATFPGYDVERANLEARQAAGRTDNPTGGTSTASNFLRGVGNDVARIGNAARSVFGLGKPNVDTNESQPPADAKPFRTLLIVAAVGLVVFGAWQLGAFNFIRRKLNP